MSLERDASQAAAAGRGRGRTCTACGGPLCGRSRTYIAGGVAQQGFPGNSTLYPGDKGPSQPLSRIFGALLMPLLGLPGARPLTFRVDEWTQGRVRHADDPM